jgi:hypothetical protein
MSANRFRFKCWSLHITVFLTFAVHVDLTVFLAFVDLVDLTVFLVLVDFVDLTVFLAVFINIIVVAKLWSGRLVPSAS